MKSYRGSEEGFTLLETVVSLGVLGIAAVTLLGGVSAGARATFIADERATADSLSRSQMEYAKDLSYSYNATSYAPAPIPDTGNYAGFSANISAEALDNPDDGIQKITVIVAYHGKVISTLETIKVDR